MRFPAGPVPLPGTVIVFTDDSVPLWAHPYSLLADEPNWCRLIPRGTTALVCATWKGTNNDSALPLLNDGTCGWCQLARWFNVVVNAHG